MKVDIKKNAPRIFTVANFPQIDPAQFFPTKVELYCQQAFGKKNPLKL